MMLAGLSTFNATVMITAFGLLFGGVILQLIVGLLTPGRKGKIHTEQSVFHPGVSAAQAWETYAQRLRFEGFQFEKGPEETALYARRRKAADALSPFEIKSFAKMPLKAEIHFEPRPDGVGVRAVLRSGSSIYVDTGEGKFIDGMVNRLLTADLERQAPPAVQNLSANAQSALYTSVLMLLAPFLFFLPSINLDTAGKMTGGIAIALFSNVVIAGLGLRDVIMKPREMRGKGRAIVAIVLSVLAMILTVVLLGLTHFNDMMNKPF